MADKSAKYKLEIQQVRKRVSLTPVAWYHAHSRGITPNRILQGS